MDFVEKGECPYVDMEKYINEGFPGSMSTEDNGCKEEANLLQVVRP